MHQGTLALLIDLLGREGLFINTRKSSIEKVRNVKREVVAERWANRRSGEAAKEFRIVAGYGGTIPTKYRRPNEDVQKRYMEVDLDGSIIKIKNDEFAEAEEVHEVLQAIVSQGQYLNMLRACEIVDMYPQFYPLFVDILIKQADRISESVKRDVIERFSTKIKVTTFFRSIFRRP